MSHSHGSCGCHEHDHGSGGVSLGVIITGAVIFVAGLFAHKYLTVATYIPLALFAASYLILGGKILLKAGKNILKGQVFDENFLMGIATIGALIIGEYAEAVAVMLFFQVGEYFQSIAVKKSKKSISDLMDIRPDYANLQIDGKEKRVNPNTVMPGDTIIVKPGEKIPLDGTIISGSSALDTSAITGESLPRSVSVSDQVFSGCINQSGLLTIKVTKTFGQSTVSKIIDLVENASARKAPAENFITTFSRYYTPVVVLLAFLICTAPPLMTIGTWSEWIRRGLVFLIISCPCALVISVPLSFFGGIGRASKNGILVKGGNYLDALSHLEIVVFDKTGTLTKGVFQVTDLFPQRGFSPQQLLELATYSEAFSSHPIALSISNFYHESTGEIIDKRLVSDYKEISGQGISVLVRGKKILAGNAKLMRANKIDFLEKTESGTKVYVAFDNKFAGCIIIRDQLKPDGAETIRKLKAKGIDRTVMLTGDDKHVAQEVARELKLDEWYAQLLPHQKVEMMEKIGAEKSTRGKLAFVGDGINDAPVLALADVGIAMGNLGSDAAIEAADVVLMNDQPSKLIQAVNIADETRKIVWQNIIFALGVKGIFLLLGALGVATLWEAVFADVGVSVLAILNSSRLLTPSR